MIEYGWRDPFFKGVKVMEPHKTYASFRMLLLHFCKSEHGLPDVLESCLQA